jgi:hypothetical protein
MALEASSKGVLFLLPLPSRRTEQGNVDSMEWTRGLIFREPLILSTCQSSTSNGLTYGSGFSADILIIGENFIMG